MSVFTGGPYGRLAIMLNTLSSLSIEIIIIIIIIILGPASFQMNILRLLIIQKTGSTTLDLYKNLIISGSRMALILTKFPLPLGAWDGLHYFIVALPEPSI